MKKLIPVFSLSFLFSINLISQWQEQFTNIPAMHYINSIDAVNDNVCWATAYGTTLCYTRTTDGGTNWICDTLQSVIGIFNTICTVDANTAYVSIKSTGAAGRIYKTTDGGNSWQLQTVAFTVLNDAPKFIHFFNSVNGVAIGSRQGNYFEVFTTSNGGTDWNKVSESNLPVLLLNENLIGDNYAASGNLIWFLTSESRIFKSTDRGLSWLLPYYAPQSFSGFDPNICFQNETNGILIANFNNIWKTVDGGLNWSQVSYSGHITPRYICNVPGASSTYVFTSQGGSNYTTDGGTNFIAIDSTAHFFLDFATSSTGWTSGASAGRIYKWIGSFVSVDEDLFPVSELQLQQNYPNPFNPTTKISWQSATGSWQTLKVYDIMGNEVATLVNEYRPAGKYEIEFIVGQDSNPDIASGVYFYKLKAENFLQTKKMLLLK